MEFLPIQQQAAVLILIIFFENDYPDIVVGDDSEIQARRDVLIGNFNMPFSPSA